MYFTVVKDGKSRGIIYDKVTEKILAYHAQYGEKIYALDRITNGEGIDEEGNRIPADQLTAEELTKEVTIGEDEKISVLEQENAELWYRNMVLESEVANLWYELMTQGGN